MGLEVSNAAGRLFVIATPIGNRDDITLRAINVLREADRILAEDTRHSRRLLDHLGIQRPMLALHEHNEAEAVQRIVDLLLQGESLALISDAGTPLISDPGFPLVRRCREEGIAVVAVPGACAAIAGLCVSGLPTDRFRFEGFLPRKQQARLAHLESLRRESATLVFYESSHRIEDALADIAAAMGEDRHVVIARELTKVHETILVGGVGEVLAQVRADENQRKGEFVVMIAGAITEGGDASIEADALLETLLEELSVKQAAGLAARITGQKKNALYQRALELSAR